MITEFPKFSKLTSHDKKSLDEFNAQFPPYADWAFGTLVTWWDIFDDLAVARIGSNLIIRSSYLSAGKGPKYTLLGNDRIDNSIKTVFAYQKKLNLQTALYSLPQYTIDAIHRGERYSIKDDPDAAEFILSTKMHAHLSGPSMYGLRKKVAQFKRAAEEHTIQIAPVTLDSPTKKTMTSSIQNWHINYKNDAERIEEKVIHRALLNAAEIDLKCLGLFIDKKLHGFALYKYLSATMINVSHIKVASTYPNSFTFMIHSLALSVLDQGIVYMNLEQDLGIEGLRIYKTRLRPVDMLHKYNLYPK